MLIIIRKYTIIANNNLLSNPLGYVYCMNRKSKVTKAVDKHMLATINILCSCRNYISVATKKLNFGAHNYSYIIVIYNTPRDLAILHMYTA